MDKWTSVLKCNPDKNGLYYTYVMNCQGNSTDIKKLKFQNGEWEPLSDKDNKIIAWKNIPEIINKDSNKWLKEHLDEIKLAFNYDYDIDYSWFCMAESLTECICEYPWFLYSNYVRYVDNVFVVRVL